MIGYLRTSPAAADAVLADMNASGNLIIAKDYLGAAYLPNGTLMVGDLNPVKVIKLRLIMMMFNIMQMKLIIECLLLSFR